MRARVFVAEGASTVSSASFALDTCPDIVFVPQVLADRIPWENLKNTSVYLQRTANARSLPPLVGVLKPEDSPYRKLVEQCWMYEPSKRPTATEVFMSVSSLLLAARKQNTQDTID